MMQSCRMSLLEAAANVVIGYVLAVMTQIAVFPLFGLWPTLKENLALGAVFTGVSLLRTYCVRRAFENWRLRLERQCAAGS
jgi:hypothetical protein